MSESNLKKKVEVHPIHKPAIKKNISCKKFQLSVFIFILPEFAFAHAGQRGHVMLLPTDLYIGGGAAVVALTFIFMIIVAGKSNIGKNIKFNQSEDQIKTVSWLSFLSLTAMFILIWIGFKGNSDPMQNLLPLTTWIVWWIGLTMGTALFGNFWNFISPWPAMGKVISFFPGIHLNSNSGRLSLGKLAYWPAVILFFLYAWLELVHPSPMDPVTLARIIIFYLIITALGMLICGSKQWLNTCEPFTVFFRMVAWLSPVYLKSTKLDNNKVSGRISIRIPCSGLLRSEFLPLSGTAFVLLVLSTVSFDGLSRTFWWLSLNGINPLEFPGKTFMVLRNTLGLFSTFLVFSVAYYLIHLISCFLNPHSKPSGSFIFSLIPIAFGYHFAHYLPTFLVDIQYALIALSDPFSLGWNLFGTSEWNVSASFLSDFDSVVTIWFLQISAIVLAHVAAVIVAYLLQLHDSPNGKNSILVQIPATLLMIGYTVFGLWLLSTPVAV